MLSRLYSWYGKTVVRSALALIALLVIVGIFLTLRGTENGAQPAETEAKSVELRPAGELSSSATIAGVGTVEAVDEALLTSEVSGRITSVSASLGDRVSAGERIAQVENASERAAVLQAEGAYEAALAGRAQSETGVASAEVTLGGARTSGIDAYRSAFTAAEGVIRNTIDPLFSDPTGLIPGFRLSALGNAVALGNERTEMEAVLDGWSLRITSNPDSSEAASLLNEAETDLLSLSQFLQMVSDAANNEENDSKTIDETSISTIRTDLITARNTMNSAIENVRNAREDIENAEHALESAEIAGSRAPISTADAQVKQALGSLRAAEAALARTIIRAPFPGTVNALSVKIGDAVSPGSPIALIANNNALEITTFVNENERERIRVGDQVRIEGESGAAITKIAPAIDPQTGKIEVKIGVENNDDVQNGDTVRIQFKSEVAQDESLTLPLRALKITPEGPVVFTVEDEVLVPISVTIGSIVGDSVVIEEGITALTQIITDARGFKEGDSVTVANSQQ